MYLGWPEQKESGKKKRKEKKFNTVRSVLPFSPKRTWAVGDSRQPAKPHPAEQSSRRKQSISFQFLTRCKYFHFLLASKGLILQGRDQHLPRQKQPGGPEQPLTPKGRKSLNSDAWTSIRTGSFLSALPSLSSACNRRTQGRAEDRGLGEPRG